MTQIIPLFGFGQQGKSPTVTAQRHLNLYAEISAQGDKSQLSFYGTPGLTLFSSTNGDTPIRGWIQVGDYIYYVHRGTFYQIDNAGTRTSRGTLNTTSGRVDMTYDGAVILMVDGTNGYTYTVASTTFTQIASGNFPNGSNTCGWLDGYFIVDAGDASDSFFISLNGTTWNALDFASAESSPDGLVRVFVDHGEVCLFGDSTTEFWGNIGAQSFPFAPVKGSTVEIGLAARWSLCKFDSGLVGLMKTIQGQVVVNQFAGYNPRKISSPDVDYLINNYATVSDATGFSYIWNGHPMYQINFPTAGKSWLYDASTQMWSPLEYGLNGARHRGEMAVDFLNKVRIADYSTGYIYNLDGTSYTDNGEAIAREIIGKHFFDGYDRMVVDELRVDFETGTGLVTGQGSDPQVMLSISKDNGHTWGNELWTDIGKIGKYLTRVVWRRLGLARDWVFKIRITDPVKVVITGAAIRARKA